MSRGHLGRGWPLGQPGAARLAQLHLQRVVRGVSLQSRDDPDHHSAGHHRRLGISGGNVPLRRAQAWCGGLGSCAGVRLRRPGGCGLVSGLLGKRGGFSRIFWCCGFQVQKIAFPRFHCHGGHADGLHSWRRRHRRGSLHRRRRHPGQLHHLPRRLHRLCPLCRRVRPRPRLPGGQRAAVHHRRRPTDLRCHVRRDHHGPGGAGVLCRGPGAHRYHRSVDGGSRGEYDHVACGGRV
mmetsp:Transcript_45259/g.119434  ORF Transcript_45259/g.119434 Transcript_45259/m.119434 type:complete len:236 (+) Transcript_45259:805-1512(+)